MHAAVHGSSHYDLPPILRWMTANIGVHHVHHANSRIPFYSLRRVLRRHPELKDVSRLTFTQSLRAVPLALWDEERKRLANVEKLTALCQSSYGRIYEDDDAGLARLRLALKAAAARRIGRFLELFGEGTNLFDVQYQEIAGVAMPGAAMSVSLSIGR